jgi:hypothetical protein
MKLANSVRKPLAVAAVLFVFALSFTSCQREGCPGQITKVETAKPANC